MVRSSPQATTGSGIADNTVHSWRITWKRPSPGRGQEKRASRNVARSYAKRMNAGPATRPASSSAFPAGRYPRRWRSRRPTSQRASAGQSVGKQFAPEGLFAGGLHHKARDAGRPAIRCNRWSDLLSPQRPSGPSGSSDSLRRRTRSQCNPRAKSHAMGDGSSWLVYHVPPPSHEALHISEPRQLS